MFSKINKSILISFVVFVGILFVPLTADALNVSQDSFTVSPGESFSFTASHTDNSSDTAECSESDCPCDEIDYNGIVMYATSTFGWEDLSSETGVELGGSSQSCGPGDSGGSTNSKYELVSSGESGSKTFNVTAPNTTGDYTIDVSAGVYVHTNSYSTDWVGNCDCNVKTDEIRNYTSESISVTVTEPESADMSVTTPSGPSSLTAGESGTYSSEYDWGGSSADGRMDVFDSSGNLTQSTDWMSLSSDPETKSVTFNFGDEGTYSVCSEGRASGGGSSASDGPKCASVDVEPQEDDPECNDGEDNDGDGDTDYPDDSECDDENDDDETPECNDGEDNDGDVLIDLNDPECSGPNDDNESPQAAQCEDEIDNDGDGWTDYPNDPGCEDNNDDDESDDPLTQCSDGIDNDGDNLTDYPDDPECSSSSDDNESPQAAECEDTVDNDGDGDIDMNDSGCAFPGDDSESAPACSDGVDNDNDGKTDTSDPGCDGPTDTDETSECDDGIDNDGDGETDYPDDPDCDSLADNDEEAGFFQFDFRRFFEK